MRLNSIVLKNYLCFSDLTVTFQPGFNAIAGVNGSGTTSILKGIREALTGCAPHTPTLGTGPFAEPNAVRVQSTATAGRYRFEEQYPVVVIAEGESFGRALRWMATKVNQASPLTWGGELPSQIWQPMQWTQEQTSPPILPIIAFYPAYRNWQPAESNEMGAATERPSRTDGYRSWEEAASDSVALQQWAISKSQERLQSSADRAVKWEDIRDDELAMVNIALAAAVDGAAGIRYDFTRKSLLIKSWMPASGRSRSSRSYRHCSNCSNAMNLPPPANYSTR